MGFFFINSNQTLWVVKERMKEMPTEREKEELRARAGGSVAFAFPNLIWWDLLVTINVYSSVVLWAVTQTTGHIYKEWGQERERGWKGCEHKFHWMKLVNMPSLQNHTHSLWQFMLRTIQLTSVAGQWESDWWLIYGYVQPDNLFSHTNHCDDLGRFNHSICMVLL